MDYLTNYYKNLCEEREQQIKVLEENLLRRGLEKVGDVIVKGFDTFEKAKSGIGGMAGEIGKGMVGAGQALSDWGGRKQEEAQYSLERSRQRDPIRIRHEQAIIDWMQSGSDYVPEKTNIVRVMEDAARHVEGFRSHARWNAYDAAREKHPYKEPNLNRKKPYTREEYVKIDDGNRKIEQKRTKIVDAAVADFDAKHAANLTLGYIAAELSKKSADINAPEPYKRKTYDPITGKEEVHSGREQHSGGHHVGHLISDPYYDRTKPVEHPDVSTYREWYNGGGHRVEGAIHPDELFGHHTAHVDYAFEHFLPDYSLQLANQRNRKAFDAAVETSKQLMSRPDPLEGQVSASGGIKTSTLRPAFESYAGSRKNFLNEKITNFLTEASDKNSASEEHL